MIVPSFGRWQHAAGRRFCRTRVYLRGYIWTPFVRIRLRYLN